MDNKSNFEQQFTQNLKASAPATQSVGVSDGSSKLPLIVAIVLAVVTLVESIALVVALTTLPKPSEDEIANDDASVDEVEYSEDYYAYDEEYNLTAFKSTCKSEDGSTYTFDLSNNFTLSGSTTASGTYTVTDSDLISLSNSDKVLYYNGVSVADGLTIYTCEEPVSDAE